MCSQGTTTNDDLLSLTKYVIGEWRVALTSRLDKPRAKSESGDTKLFKGEEESTTVHSTYVFNPCGALLNCKV